MGSSGKVGVASASQSMTVGGRYRLMEMVGSGAMGRVWRAHDELLDRAVALKELAGTDAARGRAAQEARVATGFDDPGLLRIFDVVRTTGRSWIVMEYVPGRSLYDRVTQDGPLSRPETISVGLGIMRALGTAHAAGVLHRAVEPHHVLIADDGRIVLTDLGVAAVATSAAASGTQPLFGPRHYVAPELRAGGRATKAADMWSVGATLYTAVEGYPPLSGELGAPGPLHRVIAALLAADPAARMTASAAREALLDIAIRPIGVSAVPVPALPVDDEPVVPSAEPARPRSRRRLRRAVFAAAAIAVTSAAVVGTVSVRPHLNFGGPAAAGAPVLVSAGPCAGATLQTLTGSATGPISMPAGWRWHVDPAGFDLPVPPGWTRAAINSVECFSDPGGTQVFSVTPELLNDDGPLLHWQTAEISALAAGTLPGYQRVSMAARPGGGADWEYTWQPSTGPRLHTRQVLPTGDTGASDGLSWTTPDAGWAAGIAEQNTLVAGFRGPANSNSIESPGN